VGAWPVRRPTLDANNDGFPDIFYGTESLRPERHAVPWTGSTSTPGTAPFVDDPAMGPRSRNRIAVARTKVDYNSDGWPDLLVCGGRGAALHLFENEQGHGFKDVSSILGAPVSAVDAAMVDVNHDSPPPISSRSPGTSSLSASSSSTARFGSPKNPSHVQRRGVSLAVGDGQRRTTIRTSTSSAARPGTRTAPDFLLLGNATGGLHHDDDPRDNRRAAAPVPTRSTTPRTA